ncbi:MAG: AI-2E family transporter [Verrucomicrobia bacterium]|nr:AI-2E family transporter [Verrucomicrobiota bacterium]
MIRPARLSYLFIFGLLVLVGWTHMATPLITVLFAYFALDRLSAGLFLLPALDALNATVKKWMVVAIFALLVTGILYAFGHFTKEAVEALPAIADKSIPRIVQFAEENRLPLPFDNPEALPKEELQSGAAKPFTLTKEDLQQRAVKAIKENLHFLGNFAKATTMQFVLLVIGLVVAGSLFINPQMDIERDRRRLKNNLYTLSCDEITTRFRNLYHSFATVMGAQIIISAINTTLTAIFVLSVKLPYASVIIGVTFLCGLLPIIGNIISNSVIVGIGFTISPMLAMAALAFLVILHKLEYFLNSKIIGDRIKNPVWLTLLGLIVGERVLGIPGMILAPVILHYVKMEAAQIEVSEEKEEFALAGENDPRNSGRGF